MPTGVITLRTALQYLRNGLKWVKANFGKVKTVGGVAPESNGNIFGGAIQVIDQSELTPAGYGTATFIGKAPTTSNVARFIIYEYASGPSDAPAIFIREQFFTPNKLYVMFFTNFTGKGLSFVFDNFGGVQLPINMSIPNQKTGRLEFWYIDNQIYYANLTISA